MKRFIATVAWLLFVGVVFAETVSPKLQWSRAIDRDDSQTIRHLLPSVDVTKGNKKGKTALMAAAKLGDAELLEVMLQRGLTLQDRSRTGGTALMYAALGNKTDMVSFILERTEESPGYIDAQSTNGWTAAMIAAAKGFDGVLRTLVQAGANPWLADGYQWTPLMRAIDNRHMKVVDYLLELPIRSVDLQNENGSTALHVATVHDDVRTVGLLLASGASTEIRDDTGKRALDIAIENGTDQIVHVLEKTQ